MALQIVRSLLLVGFCSAAPICTVLPTTASASDALESILATPLVRPDGSQVRIADLNTKKPLYLKFWATWCGTCLAEIPHFRAAWRAHGDDIDFYYVNLGINDDLQEVRAFTEQHELGMPVLIDDSGRVANALGLRGTPWNVLIDESLTLHMNGSSIPEEVEPLLTFLADPAAAAAEPALAADLPEQVSNTPFKAMSSDPAPALYFFLATWCDWYLEDRRPQTAARCVRVQAMVNAIAAQFPELRIEGIASCLWTDDKELNDYRARRAPHHRIRIDEDNRQFLAYSVREIPTLIMTDDQKVRHRDSDFSDRAELTQILASLPAMRGK
jgi:thiol-disulfide isomerase/thioredoxin